MGAHPGPSILHVDLDAFYASVEQMKNPELRGKPIAVGGGVVMAASYEARAFGVTSAMPLGLARRMCPQLIMVDGSFSDYIGLSDEVFEICRRYTPFVEQISIDEAFLDVSGAHHLFGTGAEIGRRIRRAVAGEVRLPISVGVASTKFLAKIASAVSKPDGLIEVEVGKELDFLHPLPIRAMWGIGPSTERKLQSLGITTVAELAEVPVDTLTSRLGKVAGRHLHALAHNRDARPVSRHGRARSVGASRTFGGDIKDPERQRAVFRGICDRVGGRLRSKQRSARTLTVTVRYADYVDPGDDRCAADLVDRGAVSYRLEADPRHHRQRPAGSRRAAAGAVCFQAGGHAPHPARAPQHRCHRSRSGRRRR